MVRAGGAAEADVVTGARLPLHPDEGARSSLAVRSAMCARPCSHHASCSANVSRRGTPTRGASSSNIPGHSVTSAPSREGIGATRACAARNVPGGYSPSGPQVRSQCTWWRMRGRSADSPA